MEIRFYSFGTTNSITLFTSFSKERQTALLKEIQTTCDRLDDLFSIYKKDSEISRINAAAGIHPVFICDTVFSLLENALSFSKTVHGAFDITICPAVRLWNIGHEEYIPSEKELQDVRHLVRYKDLLLNKKNIPLI